jgi:signal transduction histidine kinase
MKRKMRLLSVILLLAIPFSGRPQSSDLDSIREVVDSLIYASKYEEAQRLTLKYLSRENLSDEDWFSVNMLYAEVIRSSARPSKAIQAFKDILRKLPDMPYREVYESRIYMSIAGSYFDIPDYEMAAEYAEKSIAASPDTSMANTGHAVNYLILGFVDFLKGNYSSSNSRYSEALDLYKAYGLECDLPLVYTKMARVMNRMGDRSQAEELLAKSQRINSACGVEVYNVLIEETRYEICLENRDYKRALQAFVALDSINSKIEFGEQQAKLAEIEEEYEEEIEQTELDNLRELNVKNEEIRDNQNTALSIAVFGLTALAVLALLLARSIIQKRRAYDELADLNKKLESKVEERTAYLEKANEDIRLQAESITERSKQLTDFYYLVTHDLRAPISNMMMLLHLAEEAKDQEEQREMNENMKRVVQSLNSTVDDLVEKTHSHDLLDSDFAVVSFDDNLKQVRQGLTAEIKGLKAKIETDFSEASKVFYSAKILRGIFHNLLSNSLKYSHPDRSPHIRICTSREEDSIVLRFEDNGRGMDLKNHSERLFTKRGIFHQHPDAKGVGLHYLRKQILQSGGEIWAESIPGDGSVFYVRFRD